MRIKLLRIGKAAKDYFLENGGIQYILTKEYYRLDTPTHKFDLMKTKQISLVI